MAIGKPKKRVIQHTASAQVPRELKEAKRGIRLQKVLATAGVASRRACEQLIQEGRVKVNGQTVSELPLWVDPKEDRIQVDGIGVKLGKRSQSKGRNIYVLLHKPKNIICTASDPQGRTNVLDLVDLPASTVARLFPVGRLDADSTGLLLLTNDGELANHVTHPRYGMEKQYRVTIRGKLDQKDILRLKKGLRLTHQGSAKPKPQSQASPNKPDTTKAWVDAVRITSHYRDRNQGDRTGLHIILSQGQNREIRRLLARLGYNVRKLQRVAIGPLSLKGLGSGQWRLLTSPEIKSLKRAAGMG